MKGKNRVAVAVVFNPLSDGRVYYCDYNVSGLGVAIKGRAYGVDSLQALIHGVNALGAALYFSDEYKNGLLEWIGDRKGQSLGIPVAASIANLVPPVD